MKDVNERHKELVHYVVLGFGVSEATTETISENIYYFLSGAPISGLSRRALYGFTEQILIFQKGTFLCHFLVATEQIPIFQEVISVSGAFISAIEQISSFGRSLF